MSHPTRYSLALLARSRSLVRAASPGKAKVVKGSAQIKGDCGVIACMVFEESVSMVGSGKNDGTGGRLTRNWITFSGNTPNGNRMGINVAKLARLDHNDFGYMRSTAIQAKCPAGGHCRIDHNYFHGSPTNGSGEEYEAIWLKGPRSAATPRRSSWTIPAPRTTATAASR